MTQQEKKLPSRSDQPGSRSSRPTTKSSITKASSDTAGKEVSKQDSLSLSRKQTLLLLGGAACLVVIAFVVFTALGNKSQHIASSGEPVQHAARQAQPLFRLLDGIAVTDQSGINPPVTALMIENLPEVRPQSGLAGASVVYETLAEGGATRFLAVFAGPGKNLAKIGPVRSARPYYVEWASEYMPLYGHAGGSPDALRMIADGGVHDFNGIGREAKFFYRDHGIAAPHNLFTSSELIARALRDLQTPTPKDFRPWAFKDEATQAERPVSGQFVRIQFSGKAFETEWRYDQATNTYLRFNAGQAHNDALTDQQLNAKNVLVQVIKPVLDVGEKGRLTLDIHGTGKAFLFRDGQEVEGTWTKKTRVDRTVFSDGAGNEIKLNRGNTWVEVVPETQKIEAGTL